MNIGNLLFFALYFVILGTGLDGQIPETELTRAAIGVLADKTRTAQESFIRLDAALALLPYRPREAIPSILKELELADINYNFEKRAVDSLARYLTPGITRKVRKTLKKNHKARWAVRLLCEVGDPGDLKYIEPYFLDADADASLIPLLEDFGRNAQAILSELLHYSSLKSCISAQILGNMGFTDHRDIIKRYAEDNLCLIVALSEIDAECARGIAISYLESDDMYKRRRAAANLGKLKDSTYLPYLLRLLEDDDTETACNAAYALGFLEDTSGAKLLREVAKDTQTFEGDNARLLFGYLPPALVGPVLHPFLTGDFGNPTYDALEALADLRDTNSAPLLYKLLELENIDIQRLALDALAKTGLSSSAEYIYPFLEADSYQLKEGAILALGGIKDSACVSRLSLMLFWEPYT